MAGTDKTRNQVLGAAPLVVLVNPQLGENIGTAARAMANFGLHELRLVSPRDGWPNKKAKAASSGLDHRRATVFDDLGALRMSLTSSLRRPGRAAARK
jgi:tRNA/rRNA methyltransferase